MTVKMINSKYPYNTVCSDTMGLSMADVSLTSPNFN